MASRTVRTLLLIALLAAVIGTTGCARIAERAAEKVVENQTGLDIDQKGDSVTIKGKDGEVTASSSGELPEGFPKDVVPVYDGKITASLKASEGYTIGIDSTDDVATVWEWYVNEFKDGWEVKSEVKVEEGGLISAEKGDWEVQVTVGAASGSDAKSTITTFAKKRGAK